MTRPADSSDKKDPVAAGRLRFAPITEHELPKAFAADELVGATFEADRRSLEVLCDQILGVDRDFELLSNEILVDWGRNHPLELPQTAGAPRPSANRVMMCSFLCFRVLVARRNDKQDVRALVTHLFVDHAWAMIFGRELFGFPAAFAAFENSDNGVAVKLDYTRPGEYETAIVFELNRTTGPLRATEGSFWGKRREDLGESAARRVPFIQTKQLRDGLQATRACYQTFVEGQINVDLQDENVAGADLTLRLPDEKLLPASELGLQVASPSLHGYRTKALTLSVKVKSRPQRPVVRSGRSGPPLRQRRGDLQAAPPYLFTDVDIVGFRLPVRRDLLQKLCDTWLNAPFPERSYRYEPANVDLVVECLHYPSLKSENPGFGSSADDETSQRELVFRILVGRVDDDGRRIRDPSVFCPFVFVDNTPSLISGREVIGYPKLLAKFAQYPTPTQPFDACVITAVTPNPTTRKTELPLLRIDCRFDRNPRDLEALFARGLTNGKAQAVSSGKAVPVRFAWWGLGELQSGGADPQTFIEPWLSGQSYGYAGLQVKRFNDARSVRSACYHELVECNYTLLKAAVSQPTHDATLYFPKDDIYGIAKAFGFGPVVPVPPGSWYRTKADFAFSVSDPLA